MKVEPAVAERADELPAEGVHLCRFQRSGAHLKEYETETVICTLLAVCAGASHKQMTRNMCIYYVSIY